ncbi:hypothetical protein QTP86_012652 [Hemibagrus guttatus]|nr:hypothetical protein QTP86_012652 [Hemibagrus guttatus]
MDRISRRSQGLEGVRFGDHRISSLIFADDVVLLAPSSLDLQHALGRFAAECEVAGMRVSTSKSEVMVLDRKKVACTLHVGGELLPQVEEFKYLGVLFTSEGRMDREIDRWIGAAAAVMRPMYWSVVVKKELSRKAKLSIYQSIYVPTLTYGHELWVMTERIRSRIQVAEMSFLRRVAGCSLRDRSLDPLVKLPEKVPEGKACHLLIENISIIITVKMEQSRYFTRHPEQMPEPPQLAPLDVEEQRLYSKLLPGDRASYPISKGVPRHPMMKNYFGRLYPGKSGPKAHDHRSE